MDEATSALDAESEHIVQEALDEIMTNRTTIIVAHRLTTIRDVDMIIVLKDGQVVESGNHSELLSKGGEYANLVGLQMTEEYDNASSIYHSDTSENSSFREVSNRENHHHELTQTRNDQNIPSPSIWELLKLNAPEWPFALLGSVGAVLAGMEAPLFALGITHVLSAFYSPNGAEVKHEVNRIALLFVAVAVLTIPIYLLQHFFYTLMGERLTTRVRRLMFSGAVLLYCIHFNI